MKITKTTEYAIRAILYLAASTNGSKVMAKDVAKDENIPYHYAAKILQQLGKYGYVNSFKGRGGGFRITPLAKRTSLLKIANNMQGKLKLDNCLFDFQDCNYEKLCPFCEKWNGISNQITDLLMEQKVGALATEFSKN